MPSTVTDRIAGLSTSVAVKAPCRVATTANITLSGIQTIDGILLVEEDRVLVKDQTDQTTNGIWIVSSTAWSRALDFDGARDAVDGTTVKINEGTVNAAQWFNLTTDNEVIIGTDNIVWAQTYVSFTPVTAATESVAGVAELATQAETNSGTDDERIVTPLKLKALLQALPFDPAMVSTDAGATEGPTLEAYRNSATPAAADLLGVFSWAAKSSTAVKRVMGKLVGRLVDATNTSEDFAIDVYTRIAGTLASRFSFGHGFYADGLTDMGVGTVNAIALYQSGIQVGSKIVNRYYAEYLANADIPAATIPLDDTTPLIAEGTQVVSMSVTTTTATQRVRVRFSGFLSTTSSATPGAIAIFRGSTCIVATVWKAEYELQREVICEVEIAPGAAATETYSVRIGNPNTVRFNGSTSARYFGGVAKTVLVADIIEP
jgi:hypothetical protein